MPDKNPPRKVLMAQPRGFCAGVVRAISIVERALEKFRQPVYVRHEIVHNQHVVNDLKAKGAVFVQEISDIPDGAVTVFSAHGVAKSVEDDAGERNLPVLDATCPLVTKVHLQGKRYIRQGRSLILIGHAGHPEVIGTMGQIDGPVHLVQSADDIERLPIPRDAPVAYITQTTLSIDDTRLIIDALKAHFNDIEGPETRDICYATQNRQTAVRELARFADVILIVGSKNSSNSNRLREIGEESGVPSYLLGDGSEIRPEWVKDARVIGLSAGASAPEAMVQHVIDSLRGFYPVEVTDMQGIEENIEFRLPSELRYPSF